MVNALEPLIGQSIFVTDGEKWRRQRAMIDPAFSLMRIGHAFGAMREAVDDHLRQLAQRAGSGEAFSLDLAMSHLTADIICRTVFSTSLDSKIAFEVFEDFTVFERSVAQVDIMRLIFQPAWSDVPQPAEVLQACARIREHLGKLVDTHLEDRSSYNDIASAVIESRDANSGEPFNREELIDQLGVFFLAGHETTASVLTWAFYILSTQPQLVARLREEVDAVVGEGAVEFEHTKQLPLVRSVFRETLRLYPPITFIPRVALRACQVGPRRLKRGALVMIAPWTLHRHRLYWDEPDAFIPERFLPENEDKLTAGAYIPFGQGPHTCVGAGFAQTESVLIIASLLQHFDFATAPGQRIRPAARLTTRPAEQISCHVHPREPRR
jgi:cytochrome P450